MTPHDRHRIDLAAARYLEAFEAGDQAALERLWADAANDAELLAVFRETHDGLLEEQAARELDAATASIADAVAKHLPSAEIDRPATGPVTVGDVANELFRSPPSKLTADAHQMNEQLRSQAEPLPEKLALPSLIAWAEARFGSAPEKYWEAFRQAAIKLRVRANDAEYQLAARRTKQRPEASS